MQAASKGAHRRVELQDSGLGTVQEHDEAASYVGYTASPRPTLQGNPPTSRRGAGVLTNDTVCF